MRKTLLGSWVDRFCRLMARTQIFKLGCNHEDIYQYFQLLKIELFVFDL